MKTSPKKIKRGRLPSWVYLSTSRPGTPRAPIPLCRRLKFQNTYHFGEGYELRSVLRRRSPRLELRFTGESLASAVSIALSSPTRTQSFLARLTAV